MKNARKILVVFIGMLMASTSLFSQAFEKGGTYLNLHFTGSNYWNIDVQNNWGPGSAWWGRNVGGITVQMEWGIHEYVGLGFYTGVQGGVNRYYGWLGGNNYGQLALPLGAVANFHFYQLISDKTGKDIHADKLDVYAGMSVGSGLGFFPSPGWVSPLFFVGPHAGGRYFFTPKLGVSLEAGYGKSFVSGGLTFKLK